MAQMYDPGIAQRNTAVERAAPTVADALSERRDAAPTSESSRSLLITILGELALPAGGGAWTRTLLAALELLGVREKAARQALARLADDGWLVRHRVGRETQWMLTAHGRGVLEPGAARIYEFGAAPRAWDRRWLVVLASVPETDRATRYRMSRDLSWIGVGSLGHGVWVSPWHEREPEIAQLLADLGVDATTFTAEIGLLGSGESLAATAWDLAALRADYDEFLTATAGYDTSVADDTDDTTRLCDLVHRWRTFPLRDPDLPRALLPEDWPAHRAAHHFATARAALVPGARRWWRALDGPHRERG